MVSLHCSVCINGSVCVSMLLCVYLYFKIVSQHTHWHTCVLAGLRRELLFKPHAVYRVVSKYFALLLTLRPYLSLSLHLSVVHIILSVVVVTSKKKKIVARLMLLQFSFAIVNFVLVFVTQRKKTATQLKFACKLCT